MISVPTGALHKSCSQCPEQHLTLTGTLACLSSLSFLTTERRGRADRCASLSIPLNDCCGCSHQDGEGQISSAGRNQGEVLFECQCNSTELHPVPTAKNLLTRPNNSCYAVIVIGIDNDNVTRNPAGCLSQSI